jgi:hypothetical protein
MGASFGYASGVDSLDMSWLPLSRFGSRAAGVAVSCRERERGARVPHPISVGSGLEVYRRGHGWARRSGSYASSDSLDMSWLPLSRFESRAVCVAAYG